MFKAAMQRQVRLGNVARRQLSTLSPLRTARIQTLEQQSCRKTAVPFTSQSALARQVLSRLYSNESAARSSDANAESAPAGSKELVTRFADLSKLGVHPSLISAITEGMNYETMTDVQTMTVNAALNGVDLYVVPSSLPVPLSRSPFR